MKYTNQRILSLVAGLSLPFAFAPFYLFPLAFIAPFLLLLAWQEASPKESFKRGFAFGVAFFSVGISWVYVSIHIYGQAPTALAILITLFFASYLALFFGLTGYCLNRFFPDNNLIKILLAFPCCWVIFEALRGWLFTGFPWLFIGYSQSNTWLKGYAPIFGIYGLSFIVIFINALIYVFFKKVVSQKKALCSILLIFLVGFLLSKIHWTHPVGQPQKSTLIQGNIQQELKWQPEQLTNTLKLYYNYTQQHLSSDLIVWPEAAVTVPLNQAEFFLQNLAQLAKENKTSVITGIPIVRSREAFNGMVSVGNGDGIYCKRHLVPFGEYIPLKFLWGMVMNAFDIPMSNCAPGTKHQKPLLANGVYIAPYICYEIAYPLEFLAFLPKGQLLLTITDDSWFGKTIAAEQHLQIAQLRAIETGRYLLFSSNTGITAAINQSGEIIRSIPSFQEGELTVTVQPMEGTTPWMFWKVTPLLLLIGVLLFLRFRIKS